MKYQIVDSDKGLADLCSELSRSNWIGFDTEFVSEDCYRPDLCLVQVATRETLAIIDPIPIRDMGPFWELLLDPQRTIVVHAGREETLFCFRATGKLIPNLFDIQLAAGFVGMEYPASYGNLLQRMVGKQLDKGETRTDWRARPLSSQQLDYAIEDVAHLYEMHRKLAALLEKLQRTEWFREELTEWQQRLGNGESQEQWHRISGSQTLSPRAMTILRELWLWRHQLASSRNLPPRRILRDDLLVELARRGTPDPERIANLRGMNHPGMRQYLRPLSECIQRGKEAPEVEVPGRERNRRQDTSSLLTQLLGVALASICRSQRIAPMIVGTADDLRDWVNFRLSSPDKQTSTPALLTGWRKDIVGKELDGILSGKVGLFVTDPYHDIPVELRAGNDDPK